MEGLDQVSEDAGCYDGTSLHMPLSEDATSDPGRVEGGKLERRNRIARTIEGEVIPRLLMAHRSDLRQHDKATTQVVFDSRTPERFSRIVLTQPEDTALAFIHALLESGFPLESIYLDLLAPSARWLGQQWTDDELSFTDVTIALTRLQRLMRVLSGMPRPKEQSGGAATGPILLAAMPNDQHMFGILMLEEFCRREGFDVLCLPACSRHDLMLAVRRRKPAIVGLSVSVDERLDDLRAVIAEIRQASMPQSLMVMVGGRCFHDHPEWVELSGADFTAVDGREAISHIHTYLSNNSDSRIAR